MSRTKKKDIMHIDLADGRGRVPVEVIPGTVDLDQEVVRLADGRRLTEKLAAQIAEEAMAEHYRRRKAGRPSLSGKAAESPQITFRCRPDTLRRATQVAKKTGKTISALAREAFEASLRRAG